ncbi:hypothetical protein NPIL_270061 [Nephila pilipes]|uniref:Uncharacterized protein n=1 Tax=Nephila pilipes TaxID=299642 RepID=A0A8X6PQH8_NEPPI|nr:hypothetical protein NPIL_332231 [Nephila pilipes]GFU34349.1 hypothetical protein NPIL_270061 [Nephila pilipes]
MSGCCCHLPQAKGGGVGWKHGTLNLSARRPQPSAVAGRDVPSESCQLGKENGVIRIKQTLHFQGHNSRDQPPAPHIVHYGSTLREVEKSLVWMLYRKELRMQKATPRSKNELDAVPEDSTPSFIIGKFRMAGFKSGPISLGDD